MLTITIALAGFAYTYIQGTLTGKTSTAFYVIDSFKDAVTISNYGTSSITTVTAKLDDNPVNIAIVPNIQGLVGYWSVNE